MRREPHNWDTNDLERRLCHALDIAKHVVEKLAADGYADTEDPQSRVRPEKVISETAFLLVAASAAEPREAVKRRVHHLGELLIPHARSERMLLGLCLEPALSLDYAAAHICLGRLGYMDEKFDGLLRQAIECQAHRGRERVPHRILEQEWLMEAWNGASGSGKYRSATARASVLNRPLDLVGGSRDDIYAFTHALMYVTDFNIKARQVPRRRVAMLAEAEAMLARCLDEQDYDLGGEVLLAWPLLGSSWSAASAFGFRVLAHVEDTARFLPAPSTRIQRLNKLAGDDRINYLLATAYHTVYVMGLLCGAALQPGKTPPAQIPIKAGVSGRANRLLAILDADGSSPHWREEFDRLAVPERDALAGFLLNIGLRRKTTQRDFDGVAKLLRVGHTLGLTDTPAASQTAEMLERLVTFSNIACIRQSA